MKAIEQNGGGVTVAVGDSIKFGGFHWTVEETDGVDVTLVATVGDRVIRREYPIVVMEPPRVDMDPIDDVEEDESE